MAEQGTDGDIYATTSITTHNIPTSSGTTTITVGTSLSYTPGQSVIVANDDTHKYTGTVDGYNTGSGVMTVNYVSNTGTGEFSSWDINLEGAPGPQGDAGAAGDSVDIIFRRNDGQPDTPSASSSTPNNWYTDINALLAAEATGEEIWSSVGTRDGGVTNFTWQSPVQLEGQDGAEGL